MVRQHLKGYRGDSAGHSLNARGISRGRTPRSRSALSPGQLLTLRQRSDTNRAISTLKNLPNIPEAQAEEFIPDIPEQQELPESTLTSPTEEESVSFAQPKDSVEGEKPPSSSISSQHTPASVAAKIGFEEPKEITVHAPPEPPSLDRGEF